MDRHPSARGLGWIAIGLATLLAGPARAAPLVTAQVVTPDGYDSPAFSPDGKRMAALALASGHEQLRSSTGTAASSPP